MNKSRPRVASRRIKCPKEKKYVNVDTCRYACRYITGCYGPYPDNWNITIYCRWGDKK